VQLLFAPAPKRMLVVALVGALGALALVAAVNVAVDPYDLWRVAAFQRIAPHKPNVENHDRMHKARLVVRERPDALLVGTSRPQVMLDPKSPALAGYSASNAATNGAQPYDVRRLVEHAEAVRPLKLVIYALDLLAFDEAGTPIPEFAEGRLLVDTKGRAQPSAYVFDVPAAVLSLDALKASLSTARHQDRPSYLTPRGQRDPAFQESTIVKAGSQHALFALSERDYLDSYACWSLGSVDTRDPLRDPTKPIADLARLIDEVHAGGGELRLYISPMHARHREVIRLAGLDDADDRWRAAIGALVAHKRAEGKRVQLWDFTTLAFTDEVPRADQPDARMRAWWESSHATAALGEQVLARVMGGDGQTAEEIVAGSERIRAELADWEREHGGEVEEIRGFAQEILPPLRARPSCRTSAHL
jgi:hypothetical protein